jgi:hypothetical protein
MFASDTGTQVPAIVNEGLLTFSVTDCLIDPPALLQVKS